MKLNRMFGRLVVSPFLIERGVTIKDAAESIFNSDSFVNSVDYWNNGFYSKLDSKVIKSRTLGNLTISLVLYKDKDLISRDVIIHDEFNIRYFRVSLVDKVSYTYLSALLRVPLFILESFVRENKSGLYSVSVINRLLKSKKFISKAKDYEALRCMREKNHYLFNPNPDAEGVDSYLINRILKESKNE